MLDMDRFKQINDTFGHATATKSCASRRIAFWNPCAKRYVGQNGRGRVVVLLPDRSNHKQRRRCANLVETWRLPFLCGTRGAGFCQRRGLHGFRGRPSRYDRWRMWMWPLSRQGARPELLSGLYARCGSRPGSNAIPADPALFRYCLHSERLNRHDDWLLRWLRRVLVVLAVAFVANLYLR